MILKTKKFNDKIYILADEFCSEYGEPYNIGMSKKDIENLKKTYKREMYLVRVFNPYPKSSQYYNSNDNYLYVNIDETNKKILNKRFNKLQIKSNNKTITLGEIQEYKMLKFKLKR